MKKSTAISISFILATVLFGIAATNWAVQSSNTKATDPTPDYTKIKQMAEAIFPGKKVLKIQPSPVKEMYELSIPPNVYYTTIDGEYLLQGSLYKVSEKKNLTKIAMLGMEKEMIKIRKDEISSIDEDEMIIFPADEPKYTISVFTDVDCFYCRKLHGEIKNINDLGITVRYILFPRQQEGTESYDKSISVWCADDRKQTLTDAKKGLDIEKRSCDNPIAKDVSVAETLGINSTPSIVLENGVLVAGYVAAPELLKLLEKNVKLSGNL